MSTLVPCCQICGQPIVKRGDHWYHSESHTHDAQYDAQPAAPSNVDDPETWKGIEGSYDAAQSAPQTDAEELRSEQMSRFATAPTATCKGSYLLGNACGHCEKCKIEREQMNKMIPATDTRHAEAEPKAKEWMRRAAEEAVVKIEGYDKAITAFPETGRELVIRLLCEIIATHAPDVTALNKGGKV